jgi:ABC-type sugar transport system ATPase subunit
MNLLDGATARTAVANALGERFATESLSIGIRPQDVSLASPHDGGLVATVEVVEALGSATIVHVCSGDQTRLVSALPGRHDARPGDTVGVRFDPDRLHIFDADGRRLDR